MCPRLGRGVSEGLRPPFTMIPVTLSLRKVLGVNSIIDIFIYFRCLVVQPICTCQGCKINLFYIYFMFSEMYSSLTNSFFRIVLLENAI